MTQDEALAILKTGANVFLSGEPGSGKTHTVNAYVAWLRARGIEPAITASTGIAATHIGGYTIHSWSGIGIRRDFSEQDLDAISQNRNVARRIAGTQVLIIDEVSMLSARTLGMVEAVCREVRRDQRAFGGLQAILVGDFFQLPPVSPRTPDEGGQTSFINNEDTFAFSSPAWKAMNPLVCYLSEQHRQEDATFLGFLSAVRRGDVADSHRALLRTRYAQKPTDGVTQLYSHNMDVDVINDAELAKLQGEEHAFRMEGRGPDKLVASLKRGCLSPETLKLKEGARVMFTKNDHVTHKYVNGTLGIVTGFGMDGFPIVKTKAGRELVVEPDEWHVEDGGRALASVTQVPLRLAWAMTVHKSQGMSLDAAHMNLSSAFEYGQGYVALSRVRTLAGLSLSGMNERALQVHPEILAVDAGFRQLSTVARKAFANMPPAELKAMHANFVKSCGGKETSVTTSPQVKGRRRIESLAKTYSVEHLRTTHPNAYRPWSKDDDADIAKRFDAGEKPKAMAQALGRQPGSIRARLAKLGLITK
jgi:ATP-dependent exoDNAse (exonuclease V) alpha subunit